MTNISVTDDYTLGLVTSQPVAAFFTLPATVSVPAPVVEPTKADEEEDEDEDSEKPEPVRAKVVRGPRKAAAKATEGVAAK